MFILNIQRTDMRVKRISVFPKMPSYSFRVVQNQGKIAEVELFCFEISLSAINNNQILV